MKPIRRRTFSSVAGFAPRSSSPRICTLPSCAERSAPTRVSRVVLPDPEGPVTITISPSPILTETSNRICLRNSPLP